MTSPDEDQPLNRRIPQAPPAVTDTPAAAPAWSLGERNDGLFFRAIRDLPQIARPDLSLKTDSALGQLLAAYQYSGATNADRAQWLIELAEFLGDDRDPARVLLAAAVHRIVVLETAAVRAALKDDAKGDL